MDTTFEYYIDSYPTLEFDPDDAHRLLDSFLSLRRNKPRPVPLSIAVYESSLVGEHNAMSAALLSAVDGLPAPLWWQCWHPST